MKNELEEIFNIQGLLFIGAADLSEEPRFKSFRAWLDEGRHAGMRFLENHTHIRQFPSQIFEGAKQAIVFALPYYQGDKLNSVKKGSYQIAQYARLRDYHKVMRKRAAIVLENLSDREP